MLANSTIYGAFIYVARDTFMFGICWFILYGIAGPWIKTKLIKRMSSDKASIRITPFIISHLLFCKRPVWVQDF